MRASAYDNGALAGAFARYAGSLTANDAPKFLGRQPEFTVPVWDYLGGLVDAQRISDGRERLVAYAPTFKRIERRYEVPAAIVAAVWGIESDYGRSIGKRPVLDSLASLACFPSNRQSYFSKEFFAALRILQDGYVRPDEFYGSWAGAFGQTQFMPTTFFSSAVSLDGRRDIIRSVPDSLASIAHFLRQHGWRRGEPWGFEVVLPPHYSGPIGRFRKRPMSFWRRLGLKRPGGAPLGDGSAGLILPAGRGGPAFLTTGDFDVLTSYNAAEAYGLAIGLLADRLAGGGGLVGKWLHRGMSRVQRRETQILLRARGYDVGRIDGVLGDKSRRAIADVERKLGRSADGWASVGFLDALHSAR